MTDLFPITRADKLACLEREIALRVKVYARKIADGSMSIQKAEREMEVMRAIAEDYRNGGLKSE
jgi:hypothetical protein